MLALVASHRPAVVVVDACWLGAWPDLPAQLATQAAAPKILLCAESLAMPGVLAAVQQGVHSCVSNQIDAATWHKAILAVHAGDIWIPRRLMADALADLMTMVPSARWSQLQRDKLTERQIEIVRCASQGLSNKEIARRMGISPTTVKTHMQNIFERTGTRRRQQLVLQARGEFAA
jgi:DNA-binding NarL/FixJ family response regulator